MKINSRSTNLRIENEDHKFIYQILKLPKLNCT